MLCNGRKKALLAAQHLTSLSGGSSISLPPEPAPFTSDNFKIGNDFEVCGHHFIVYLKTSQRK